MKLTPALFRRLAGAVLTLLALNGASAVAQSVPDQLNYQGILLQGDGTPVPAVPIDVEFRVYDTPTAATGLQWGRMFRVTPDANGAFNVVLSGEGALLNGAPDVDLRSAFTGPGSDSRYLELTVAGSTPIRPRQRFVAAAYAFLAHDVTEARANFTVNGTLSVVGAASLGSLNASGTATVGTLASAGAASVGSLSSSGAATVGSLTTPGSVTASNFVGFGTIPLGGIIMWSGSTVPAGWALCDGQNNTPDLRGRFVLGAGTGPGLTPRAPGATGGEEKHQLTIAEMPKHHHRIGFGATTGDDGGGAWYEINWNTGWNEGEIEDTGGDLPHNLMPPFYALAFIMRVQ